MVIAGKAKTPGAKRLLLCVHGFPESHLSWRHQLQVCGLFLHGYWQPVNTLVPDAPWFDLAGVTSPGGTFSATEWGPR